MSSRLTRLQSEKFAKKVGTKDNKKEKSTVGPPPINPLIIYAVLAMIVLR